MISMDKQYKTKEGKQVKLYAVEEKGHFPVHGATLELDGRWDCMCWTDEGKAFRGSITSEDLVEVKPALKIGFWINLYSAGEYSTWLNKEDADLYCSEGRVACIFFEREVEYGEGI